MDGVQYHGTVRDERQEDLVQMSVGQVWTIPASTLKQTRRGLNMPCFLSSTALLVTICSRYVPYFEAWSSGHRNKQQIDKLEISSTTIRSLLAGESLPVSYSYQPHRHPFIHPSFPSAHPNTLQDTAGDDLVSWEVWAAFSEVICHSAGNGNALGAASPTLMRQRIAALQNAPIDHVCDEWSTFDGRQNRYAASANDRSGNTYATDRHAIDAHFAEQFRGNDRLANGHVSPGATVGRSPEEKLIGLDGLAGSHAPTSALFGTSSGRCEQPKPQQDHINPSFRCSPASEPARATTVRGNPGMGVSQTLVATIPEGSGWARHLKLDQNKKLERVTRQYDSTRRFDYSKPFPRFQSTTFFAKALGESRPRRLRANRRPATAGAQSCTRAQTPTNSSQIPTTGSIRPWTGTTTRPTSAPATVGRVEEMQKMRAPVSGGKIDHDNVTEEGREGPEKAERNGGLVVQDEIKRGDTGWGDGLGIQHEFEVRNKPNIRQRTQQCCTKSHLVELQYQEAPRPVCI